MARLLAIFLLTLAFLAGCMTPSRGPVELAPVTVDLDGRGRGNVDSPVDPQGGGQVPACKSETVDAGTSVLARIHCKGGSGTAVADLHGCAVGEEPAWLMLSTEEGRLAQGNATAEAVAGARALAQLTVQASQEDGKEAMVQAASGYRLRLTLEAWNGEWVEAMMECRAASGA